MDKLPEELVLEIFRHLPPETLHSAFQVCKPWSRLRKRLGVCQLNLTSLGDGPHSYNRIMAKITKEIPTEAAGSNIRHVLIHYHRLLPPTIFTFIQRLCPNVISFDYNYDLLDNYYPNLRFGRARHSFLASPSWRNSIAHLPLCHDGYENLAADTALCERLESLAIHSNSPIMQIIGYGYFSLHLPSFPRLTSLTVHHPYAKFQETVINAIDHHYPRLYTLTLRDVSLTCMYRREYVVSDVAPNLKNLTLANVTFLSNQTSYYFPLKFPNVQSLSISFRAINVPNVWRTYQRINDLIVRFEHLTSLVVRVQGWRTDSPGIWFQHQMEAYRDSHQNIHIDIRFF